MKDRQYSKKYWGEELSQENPTRREVEKDLAKCKKYLVDFIKSLPEKARVLDAGCGKGKTIRILRAFRPDLEIYAIDISAVEEMILPGVKFQTSSVDNVGNLFEENFFDAVICQNVIEHLITPIAMMESFKKVLKPQGRLFLETGNWSTIIFPFYPKYFWRDYTHLRIFSKATFKKLFDDYDFRSELIKSINSSGFFVRNDSLRKVKKTYQDERQASSSFTRKMAVSLANRIINLFIKDMLIAIAVNEK